MASSIPRPIRTMTLSPGAGPANASSVRISGGLDHLAHRLQQETAVRTRHHPFHPQDVFAARGKQRREPHREAHPSSAVRDVKATGADRLRRGAFGPWEVVGFGVGPYEQFQRLAALGAFDARGRVEMAQRGHDAPRGLVLAPARILPFKLDSAVQRVDQHER